MTRKLRLGRYSLVLLFRHFRIGLVTVLATTLTHPIESVKLAGVAQMLSTFVSQQARRPSHIAAKFKVSCLLQRFEWSLHDPVQAGVNYHISGVMTSRDPFVKGQKESVFGCHVRLRLVVRLFLRKLRNGFGFRLASLENMSRWVFFNSPGF